MEVDSLVRDRKILTQKKYGWIAERELSGQPSADDVREHPIKELWIVAYSY